MAIDPAIAVTSELSGAERSAQRTARLRCRPHGRTAALGPRGVASRAPRAPVGRAARTPRCRRRNGASGGRRAGHSGGAGVQQVSPSRPRGAPRSAATSVARPPPGGATQRPTAAPARGPRAPPRAALRRRRGSAGRRLGAGRCPTRRAPPPARPACPAPQLCRRGAAYLRRPHKGWPLPSGQSHPLAGARCLRPPSAAPATQAAAAQVSHQSLMRGGRATERQPPSTRPGRLPPKRAEPCRTSPPARRLGQRSGGRPPRAAPLKGSAPPPPPPRPARPPLPAPPERRAGHGGAGPGGGRGGGGGCWFTLAGPERCI